MVGGGGYWSCFYIYAQAKPNFNHTLSDVRLTAIDALRGFAFLGTLLINILGFAMISAAYVNVLNLQLARLTLRPGMM